METRSRWIIDILTGDTVNTWIVGSPQTFLTNVEDRGVSVTARSPAGASVSYHVYTDDPSAALSGTSPDRAWASVADNMDTMVESVHIIGEMQP